MTVFRGGIGNICLHDFFPTSSAPLDKASDDYRECFVILDNL